MQGSGHKSLILSKMDNWSISKLVQTKKFSVQKANLRLKILQLFNRANIWKKKCENSLARPIWLVSWNEDKWRES